MPPVSRLPARPNPLGAVAHETQKHQLLWSLPWMGLGSLVLGAEEQEGWATGRCAHGSVPVPGHGVCAGNTPKMSNCGCVRIL